MMNRMQINADNGENVKIMRNKDKTKKNNLSKRTLRSEIKITCDGRELDIASSNSFSFF